MVAAKAIRSLKCITHQVHRAWGALAGYGYRTGRLIAALLLAIIAAGALAGHIPIRDDRYVAAHTKDAERPNTSCRYTSTGGEPVRSLPRGPTHSRPVR